MDDEKQGTGRVFLILQQLRCAIDERLIVWFDIDNTLYPASTNIAQAMTDRIYGQFPISSFRLQSQ
jgi:hypothetical protein